MALVSINEEKYRKALESILSEFKDIAREDLSVLELGIANQCIGVLGSDNAVVQKTRDYWEKETKAREVFYSATTL